MAMMYRTVDWRQGESIIEDTDDLTLARSHARDYSRMAETTAYIYTDDEPYPTERYAKGQQKSAVTVYPTFSGSDAILVHVEHRAQRVLIAYIAERANQFGRCVAIVTYRAKYVQPVRAYCRVSDALAAIREWTENHVAQGKEL